MFFSIYIFQLTKILKSHPVTRNVFVNVHASDTLPPTPRTIKPCAYISNTAPWRETGEHWVCFFFAKNSLPEYFDSFALDILPNFSKFLGEKYLTNTNIIQSIWSTSCGQHVIDYIYKRRAGYSMCDIVSVFDESNLLNNDLKVNQSVESNFGVDLKIYDKKFVLQQLLG